MNPRTAILSGLLVIGLAGIAQAEENVTIGDLLKSPGSYQAKLIIVHGMVRNAPRYQRDDPECGALVGLHKFQLVDESGAIEIVAMGCGHGTLSDYGGQFYQLSNGEILEVMGRVVSSASGFVVELERMALSSLPPHVTIPRVTIPKDRPSR